MIVQTRGTSPVAVQAIFNMSVKSFVEKAFSTLTRRRPNFESVAFDEQELHTVSHNRQESCSEQQLTATETPSPVLSPVDQIDTLEADDILFRKNNVCLKYPRKSSLKSSSSLPKSMQDYTGSLSSSLVQSGDSLETSSKTSSLDNQILIPGFLFITTRGSDFGTTLILNWTPNSSMHAATQSSLGNSTSNRLPVSRSSSTSSASSLPFSRGASREDFDGVDQEWPSSSVSIDLGLMEVIRVFYRIDNSGLILSGEMVITSKDRNFKVFHFKNGGLNDLIHLFRSWKFFKHHCHKETHQHTFTIFRPKLSLSELHPEEGTVQSVLTEEMWRCLLDSDGRIVDEKYVRKVVFLQGISPSIRKEVWPFLLDVFSFDSTQRKRDNIKAQRREEYWALDSRRKENERTQYMNGVTDDPVAAKDSQRSNSPEEALYHQIEKDVVRTDRATSYYKGEDNVHCKTLMDIVLNYLVFKPDIRYCQGMTDLLAPLLAALDDEAEAFWCFTNLVQSSAFYKPGKDHISVSHQIEPLRVLIRMLIPSFFAYLERIENGTSLMFCHRWLLVCLKREFHEEDALTIWEACWSNYKTTSFHLFICVAIMAIYGQKAIDRNMNINELMVFFNTLSYSIPRDIVLSQARGYLHQFCTSSEVNCLLSSVMNKEFWESKESPRLTCSVCKGIGSCSRTGFVTDHEAVC